MSRPLEPSWDVLLEVQTPSIPPDIIELINEISRDRNASNRERDLAHAMISFARAFERLVSNLEHGTLSIRAYEKDVEIYPPRRGD